MLPSFLANVSIENIFHEAPNPLPIDRPERSREIEPNPSIHPFIQPAIHLSIEPVTSFWPRRVEHPPPRPAT